MSIAAPILAVLLASTTVDSVRVATFNTSLYRDAAGALAREMSEPGSTQTAFVAEIIQRVAPDIILLNEFDWDEDGVAARAFVTNYLGAPHDDAAPIEYPYIFSAPSNTGVSSGHDLDGDGTVEGAGDAFGYGPFPGAYGMVVLSRYPIRTGDVRTFRTLRWSSMPGSLLPGDWYDAAARSALRLSSKSHWDVPIEIDGRVVHVLASHPTPPVFDGPEDRNGRRNDDEIRFWIDYIDDADWIRDDAGRRGGLAADASFVIAGDLNADPQDGDGRHDGIKALLTHPRVQDPQPRSPGAVAASIRQGGVNGSHQSDPALDTGDFRDDGGPGNLRLDYVLPSADLTVSGSIVFWPTRDDPLFRLVGDYPFPASDHRLVFVDLDWSVGRHADPIR